MDRGGAQNNVERWIRTCCWQFAFKDLNSYREHTSVNKRLSNQSLDGLTDKSSRMIFSRCPHGAPLTSLWCEVTTSDQVTSPMLAAQLASLQPIMTGESGARRLGETPRWCQGPLIGLQATGWPLIGQEIVTLVSDSLYCQGQGASGHRHQEEALQTSQTK